MPKVLTSLLAIMLLAIAFTACKGTITQPINSDISLWSEGAKLDRTGGINLTGNIVSCSDNSTINRVDCSFTDYDKFSYSMLTVDFENATDTYDTVPDFGLTLAANSTYVGQAFLYMNNGPGSAHWSWTVSGTVIQKRAGGAFTDSTVGTGNLDANVSTTGTGYRMGVYDIYITTDTGGDVGFEFGENTYSATPSYLLAGSYIKLTRVQDWE